MPDRLNRDPHLALYPAQEIIDAQNSAVGTAERGPDGVAMELSLEDAGAMH